MLHLVPCKALMLFWVATFYFPCLNCNILCDFSGLKLNLPQVPENFRWSFVLRCESA
jgi:hypothetical protein